ncbi:MAG: restriction endonuclease [FCB group bacterium]|jgi:hypothetical protein
MEHIFTSEIRNILKKHFKHNSEEIFEKSQLIQYINLKTKSANKGVKSRASFANLYAIYVIIEDYIQNDFDKRKDYSNYEGAPFTKLFHRQRQLPFGSKLQNHALNNRLNAEFQKFFPTSEFTPILRNLETNRYWINENLIKIKIGNKTFNIANSIIDIIDAYSQIKKDTFEKFIKYCKKLQSIESQTPNEVIEFIQSLISITSDARIFEIVSYAILKFYYHDQNIYWGFDIKKLNKENLKLYKTGRTNANDGGIDFVMKPLGRFFQVTETLDVKKYFLDIEKIERYPITFVIKSDLPSETLMTNLQDNALLWYSIKTIVNKYIDCIEEIINIPELIKRFNFSVKQGYLNNILEEIIIQSKVEFNYEED